MDKIEDADNLNNILEKIEEDLARVGEFLCSENYHGACMSLGILRGKIHQKRLGKTKENDTAKLI